MKRLLIIAYFFEPFPGVGTKRVTYWAENIKEISKEQVYCDVMTSINPENINFAGVENLYYIPNTNSKNILGHLIKDEGLSWKKDVKNFINSNDIPKYDYVLISGGPFMHFSLGQYFKDKFRAKIIFDFRDPFSNNPRFAKSFIKNNIKGYYENKFIKYADAYLTVNQYCKNLVGREKQKGYVIENGYDEKVLNEVINQPKDKKEELSLIYTGTIYSDFNIQPFATALNEDKFEGKIIFNYAGKNGDIIPKMKCIKNNGQLSYKDSLSLMNNNDIGLIFTGGKPFESTTKIFEYIGCDKKILIITNGEPYTGNIHEITKDIEGIYWASNTVQDIREKLTFLLGSKDEMIIRNDKEQFSRAKGTEKLVKLISSLG